MLVLTSERGSRMKVTILYDNYAVSRDLSVGWGFSCLIEDQLLFDTGESGKALLENIKSLDIDINNIKGVVISHDHWDHTGGLWEILKKRPGLPVYACSDFSPEFKEEVQDLKGHLIEVSDFSEIMPDIYATGPIAATYKGQYLPEQALVVKSNGGVSVITGCSHPGVIIMLRKIRDSLGIESFQNVFGGFHMPEQDKPTIKALIESFQKLGVTYCGPTHCSGKRVMKMFQKAFADHYLDIKVGMVLEV